eukprot:TRINITY_DN19_c0_g1_i2.p1 TRINITY_DN19_c0_g1~~TRINITY_DN19_c0_g1_i2.p1  ORF type:complete len:360 (-),score=88.70 TRINITY_DN19_c0_g1_i2:343-1422(-)
MSTTAGSWLRKRQRCGMGPSTQSATRRQRPGVGPRTGRKGRYRMRGASSVSLRRKTRRIKSFAALARKVQWNSQKLHGALQRNMQTTEFDDEHGGDIREKYPLLLDITNFTSDNLADAIPADAVKTIFKMAPSPVTPGAYFASAVGGFDRDNMVGLNNGGLSLWAKMNADIPDTGKYFAVGSKYRLKFTVTGSVRIRIQVFTVNTRMIGYDSKFRQFALPGSLDMLSKMCTGNQLPRKYFKVYKDFEKVMDPANNQTSGDCLVTFSFHHNKMCEQYLTNPAVGGTNPIDNLNPGTISANNASGIHNVNGGFWFNYENVPQGQPLWMLISSDVVGDPTQASQNKASCSISRTVMWRDHIG